MSSQLSSLSTLVSGLWCNFVSRLSVACLCLPRFDRQDRSVVSTWPGPMCVSQQEVRFSLCSLLSSKVNSEYRDAQELRQCPHIYGHEVLF